MKAPFLDCIGRRVGFRPAFVLTLAVLLALGLMPLSTLLPGIAPEVVSTVEAKRGKNHDRGKAKIKSAAVPGPCEFTQTATTWKLNASCTITAPINIPAGVTLDGNDKTITMTGPVLNYRQFIPDNWRVDAGILANGGTANVRRLTLKGTGLSGACSPEGIAFINTSGTIEDVTVTNLRRDDGISNCGVGISATGTGGQHVTIRDVRVSGSPQRQLWGLSRANTAGITVDIEDAKLTVTKVPFSFAGITYFGPVSGSIEAVDIDVQNEQGQGINIFNPGSLSPREVAISNVDVTGRGAIGISATGSNLRVDVDRTEVKWQRLDPSAPSGTEQGIGFFAGVEGTVTNSEVRNTRFAAISAQDGTTVALTNNDVKSSFIGVLGTAGSDVTIDGASIEDVLAGVVATDAGSTVAVTGSQITGGRAGPNQAFGILYQIEAAGSVDGTRISKFFDTNPDTVSCGIGLAADAGPVEIGQVSYPSPGNEQNLCDPVGFQQFRRGGTNSIGGVPAISEAIAAQAEAVKVDPATLDRPDARAEDNGKAKGAKDKQRGKRGQR